MSGYDNSTPTEKIDGKGKSEVPYGYIYLIENMINKKCYVGQTKQRDPQCRWRQHVNDSAKPSPVSVLGHAIKKYGPDNFSFSTIDHADSAEELNTKERSYIIQHNSSVNNWGYNLKEGGYRGTHTPETRLRMSLSHKGKKLPPRTQEHRKNISDSLTGKKYGKRPQEWCHNISMATKGKKKPARTTSHAENMSLALSQEYIVYSPGGVTYNVTGLDKFCKILGLNSSNMFQVAKGSRTHHKGWKVKKVGKR